MTLGWQTSSGSSPNRRETIPLVFCEESCRIFSLSPYHIMQTAVCVLLLTWGALAHPPSPKDGRSIAGNEADQNYVLDSTKTLLMRVTDFMNRITDLTQNSEKLTSEEAMTMLPDFVVEAVRLRDELDMNEVKNEDPEAVQRVMDTITMSLHSFAQRYDGQGGAAKEPEPVEVITEQPEADHNLEVTTTLAPVEEEVETEVAIKENVVEESPATSMVFDNRPFVPVNNPFSNVQAFRFSNPITTPLQESRSVVKLLPAGGYYVYYNQGR